MEAAEERKNKISRRGVLAHRADSTRIITLGKIEAVIEKCNVGDGNGMLGK